MFLKNISINQFKSHEQLNLDLVEGLNIFCGKNGTGKTNVIDAIYLLLNGKSYFNSNDNLCIKQDENYFLLKGNILKNSDELKLMVSYQTGKRKNIKCNEKSISKMIEYFGKFPCVMIAPGDIEIINGDSEHRRIFFDYIFSIIDSSYLNHLVQYNKVLENRNKQLKIFIENNTFDNDLLDIYNNQLELHGNYIFKSRNELTELFKKYFEQAYLFISDGNDMTKFLYQSGLQTTDYKTGFLQSLQKDRVLGRTTFGIHRDDWGFEINNLPLKKTGSQGQIKSFLISLKFAMFNLILEKKHVKPILLLDDIFEKIDNYRIEKLKEIISNAEIGQIFITDTSIDRINDIFRSTDKKKIINF